MLKKILFMYFVLVVMLPSFVTAQAPPSYSRLDPKPYDPETDPNIDMFISSWKESTPRHTHGSLIERDIFTECKGDPLHPVVRGAVLSDLKRFAHGTLFSYASTSPTTLVDEQEIFFIASGKGTITAGGKTAELHEGVGILMPPGVEFTMRNTEDESLTMYIFV